MCLKGKSTVKKKDARFRCEKCSALSDTKKGLCKPEKFKAEAQPDKKKAKAKGKKAPEASAKNDKKMDKKKDKKTDRKKDG